MYHVRTFKGENENIFKNKMERETTWNLDEDNIIWTMMANRIKGLTKKILGETKVEM